MNKIKYFDKFPINLSMYLILKERSNIKLHIYFRKFQIHLQKLQNVVKSHVHPERPQDGSLNLQPTITISTIIG